MAARAARGSPSRPARRGASATSCRGARWCYTTRLPWTRSLVPPRHSVLNQWDLLAPLGHSRHPRPEIRRSKWRRTRTAAGRVDARLRGAGVSAGSPPRRDPRQRRQPVSPLAGRNTSRPLRPQLALVDPVEADYHHLWTVGIGRGRHRGGERRSELAGAAADRIVRCGEFDLVGTAGARGPRRAVCRRRQRAAAHRRHDRDADRRALRADAAGAVDAVAPGDAARGMPLTRDRCRAGPVTSGTACPATSGA